MRAWGRGTTVHRTFVPTDSFGSSFDTSYLDAPTGYLSGSRRGSLGLGLLTVCCHTHAAVMKRDPLRGRCNDMCGLISPRVYGSAAYSPHGTGPAIAHTAAQKRRKG